MERYYAYDINDDAVIYRIPGHVHGDGQIDSDDEPVWLLGAEHMILEEGYELDELERVDPEKPHTVPAEYQ